MNISKELITVFRDDLCKDQRKIEIIEDNKGISRTGYVMRKYSSSTQEYENEQNVISYLIKLGMDGIPKILSYGKNVDGEYYIDIEYFDGIRVYNVLAYLREIIQQYDVLAERAKAAYDKMIQRCLLRQKRIQEILISWAKTHKKNDIYPQKKVLNIVKLLSEVMDVDINLEELNKELEYITVEFNKIAEIPFRDSTTKNMVLYCPEMYIGNFVKDGEDIFAADFRRKEYFKDFIGSDRFEDFIDNTPIIDFDFSSCEHLTSVYDDPIGFLCHEITWQGMPNKSDLIWVRDNREIVDKDIALSFIVRYMRFGGRKIAYHIFHPNAYKYRFCYDNEDFYFNNLNKIILHYWSDAKKYIPQLMNFITYVKTYDKKLIIDDVDEFEMFFPNSNRKFYLDLFPY